MGTQEGYIIVTGKHMSRCQMCGTRTVLTKEVWCEGKKEVKSICYDCQTIDISEQPTKDPGTISSCAAGQKPLEKYIIMH